MKKLTIMSDNHGSWFQPLDVLDREQDSDYFIHCGDNEGDDDDLDTFIAVRGNCDLRSNLPIERFLEVEGIRIGIVHGHSTGTGINRLLKYMEEHHLDLLFYGHTHEPRVYHEDHKWIINPGSTNKPRGGSIASYAVVTIDNGKVDCEIKEY